MDSRSMIERLLDYVRQDAEDLCRCGDDIEITAIRAAIADAEQYLSDSTPATPHLTYQELNTVLACMRYCQYGRVDLSGMDHFEDESYGPLSWDAVDRLIEDKLYELAE